MERRPSRPRRHRLAVLSFRAGSRQGDRDRRRCRGHHV